MNGLLQLCVAVFTILWVALCVLAALAVPTFVYLLAWRLL